MDHSGNRITGDENALPQVTVMAAVLETPETVLAFMDAVARVMDREGKTWELLLIDDGSGPDTWTAIQSAAQTRPWLWAVRLSRNFGKEAALMAGFDYARGQAVIILDGDLQHPPQLISRMLEIWDHGKIPIVEGVRVNRDVDGRFKRFSVDLYYRVFKLLSGVDLKKNTDYVLLDRSIVEELKKFRERQTYFRGLAHYLGYERAQVPFEVAPRTSGMAGWSVVKQIRHGVLGLSSFSAKPVYLIAAIGFFGLVLSLLLGMQTFYNYLSGNAYPGFSTVILLQLIFGSIELSCMGLLGIYIVNIYVEVKNRPRYLVGEVLRPQAEPGAEKPAKTDKDSG